jgi:predicted Holliday junction resolvase-like endonuclease
MREPVVGLGACLLVLILIIGGFLWGWPKYRIYQQTLRGEATLREAEWDKKVRIEEARAKKEAAILEKEAEVIRAEGVRKANEIIAGGLGGHEGYLRYLWIQGLQDGSSEVIYIPTEAGLPILEARDNR